MRCPLSILFAVALVAVASEGTCKTEEAANGLSIHIVGTRPHLAVGQSFSLCGTITNNTANVVYVNEEYIRLTVPKELEGPSAADNSFWYGTLPAANAAARKKENNFHATLAIKPGDATAVRFLWKSEYLSPSPGLPPSALTLARFYLIFVPFFTPGSYQLAVTVDYWADPAQVGNSDPARSVEMTSLDVAAPLWVILIGAAIGGMIAYKVLPPPQAHRKRGEATSGSIYDWRVKAGTFLGPILLAVIIAILWARLSDAVFPFIRLTITDLWGGIAVGFIGNYFGLSLLDKMKNKLAKG